MKGVQLTKLAQELNLTNLTPDIDLTEIYVKTAEINRPALQLTGYLEHFANERVQIIGYVEYTYLEHLSRERRLEVYEQFLPIVKSLVLEDEAYQNACKNSDRENAYLEGEAAIKRVVATIQDARFIDLYYGLDNFHNRLHSDCLLYTSDAADE